jgi:hypothetical protein
VIAREWSGELPLSFSDVHLLSPSVVTVYTRRCMHVKTFVNMGEKTMEGLSEYDIHKQIVRVLNVAAREHVIWFHVPNGEARNVQTLMKLKAMGVKPGVADLVFIAPTGVGFLELKSKKGRMEASQLAFRDSLLPLMLHSRMPLWYEVARSVDEALAILREKEIIDDGVQAPAKAAEAA